MNATRQNLSKSFYSENLEFFSFLKPNRTKLNMILRNPKFFNISMFFRVRFLVFFAFKWSICYIWMILMSSVRSNKKYRNIEKVRLTRRVLELHCIQIYTDCFNLYLALSILEMEQRVLKPDWTQTFVKKSLIWSIF